MYMPLFTEKFKYQYLPQFYRLFDLSKDLIHSKVFAIQYSSVVSTDHFI